MVKFTILAGGFTSFIATYLFDSDANSIVLLGESKTGPNASWISPHPTENILYAVNGVGPGALQSFTINPNGSLAGPVDEASSGGQNAVFAEPLSTGQVVVVNYSGGNGQVIPTTSDPLHFDKFSTPVTFPAPDNGFSHPHMALQYGVEVFVPDLVRINLEIVRETF